jgi:formylglycine-generating enzyme required for sulfatase activity
VLVASGVTVVLEDAKGRVIGVSWPTTMNISAGVALLVEAPASVPQSARLPVSAFGELFLASSPTFDVQLLASDVPYGRGADCVTLKQNIDQFVRREAVIAVLILTGEVAETPEGPALIVGRHWQEYPRESTISLRWLGERIREARAEIMMVALAVDVSIAEAHQGAAPWSSLLAPLENDLRQHLVVAHDPSLVEVLWTGMRGGALDRTMGAITLQSLGEYLQRSAPGAALQQSRRADTLLFQPPHVRGVSWPVTRATLSSVGDEEPIGSVLPGRFRIVHELARGGFGIVYQARQISVGRDVAVKILQRNVGADSDEELLFLREIEAVGRLAHPNIVRILQADVTPGGRLFFAMELVPGRDLESLLREERTLAEDRAVSLIEQALSGLAAAHAAGVVHADIKPANIMVVPGDAATGQEERTVLLDFGLARLKPRSDADHDDQSVGDDESFGGTPAFMAPEQLYQGRVDARSDLFAVGLVLYQMLTGWRRQSFEELVPPLDELADPHLRSVLSRALAVEPAARFESARAFASALRRASAPESTAPQRAPFHRLSPLGEDDSLFGRDQALFTLLERVLFQPAVIYTAPSGTGKTSLVRAGLLPRLSRLGVHPVYLTCRPGVREAAMAAMRDLEARARETRRRTVIILDQVEALFLDATLAREQAVFLDTLLDACHRDRGAPTLSLLLCIREDFLARLIERSHRDAIPIVRLAPLTRAEAHQAITAPLALARIGIDDDLLDRVLDELERAGGELARSLGWALDSGAIYPPHLQLVCSVLYESLAPGESRLSLAHYQQIGGLDAVLAEHLDRVLDTDVEPDDTAAARALFLELASSAQTRVTRTETELFSGLGAQHPRDRLERVLEVLRRHGLIVPVRSYQGERGWELVHDSLIPRVLAWADRHDLGRRRVQEMLRHHLRRSTREQPSLLGRAELRELARYPAIVEELEREHAAIRDRHDGVERGPWTPRALVRRSRRRVTAVFGLAMVAVLLAGIGAWRWLDERSLRQRDLGRFELSLSPFDWNTESGQPRMVSADALPALDWKLFEPDVADLEQAGLAVEGARVVRPSRPRVDEDGRHEQVEARGGPAFLRVTGREPSGDDCPPAWIRLRRLPGYAEREHAPARLRVLVPTCQATMAGMIDVPGGEVLLGGPGEPPSRFPSYVQPETRMVLDAFRIDATEVSNRAYEVYARMAEVTGRGEPVYPEPSASRALRNAGAADHPVTGINWYEARDYCRFLGKDLPTTEQWEKAARGGLYLDDPPVHANPLPDRNLPWGLPPSTAGRANIGNSDEGTLPVGSLADGASPYGVLDMAGNVYEWTGSDSHEYGGRMKIMRGGSFDSPPDLEHHTIAYDNTRRADFTSFEIGVRCVLALAPP